ncbi:MAG: SIS domain-containing protein [Candidatus Omnitrophota bacterium]
MDYVKTVKDICEESWRVKESFFSNQANIELIAKAAKAIVSSYRRGGKLIVFGNGGSASDSQHMAAELVVRFEKERKSFPCIALTTDTSVLTAVSNDYDFNKIFTRQIEALAGSKDIIFAISTSGNSKNVLDAVKTAREKKIPVIALTGAGGGSLAVLSDIPIVVESNKTARIQELHITIIHIICKIIEDTFI